MTRILISRDSINALLRRGEKRSDNCPKGNTSWHVSFTKRRKNVRLLFIRNKGAAILTYFEKSLSPNAPAQTPPQTTERSFFFLRATRFPTPASFCPEPFEKLFRSFFLRHRQTARAQLGFLGKSR